MPVMRKLTAKKSNGVLPPVWSLRLQVETSRTLRGMKKWRWYPTVLATTMVSTTSNGTAGAGQTYDATGGSFELAYRFLEPYSLAADRVSPRAINEGCRPMVRALKKQGKWDRVVIGLSDHTDNDNVDPFAGYEGKKKYIAAPAIFNNVESFKNLQTSIIRMYASKLVYTSPPFECRRCFTAPRFQPGFTSHLLLAFCEIVLIERFTIGNSFQHNAGAVLQARDATQIYS
ncbi:hypothetical protein DFH29DRAFT_882013 [Suillus ampliporus]|nr:hypothetical protein DFH29DRAFT_882013 [Suillus ampliporus]